MLVGTWSLKFGWFLSLFPPSLLSSLLMLLVLVFVVCATFLLGGVLYFSCRWWVLYTSLVLFFITIADLFIISPQVDDIWKISASFYSCIATCTCRNRGPVSRTLCRGCLLSNCGCIFLVGFGSISVEMYLNSLSNPFKLTPIFEMNAGLLFRSCLASYFNIFIPLRNTFHAVAVIFGVVCN